MNRREQEQLEQIVALLGDVLGPDAVGVYLHGSAVLGGLRPRSDLDVLALSRPRPTCDEKRALVDRLSRSPVAALRPGRRVRWS